MLPKKWTQKIKKRWFWYPKDLFYYFSKSMQKHTKIKPTPANYVTLQICQIPCYWHQKARKELPKKTNFRRTQKSIYLLWFLKLFFWFAKKTSKNVRFSSRNWGFWKSNRGRWRHQKRKWDPTVVYGTNKKVFNAKVSKKK